MNRRDALKKLGAGTAIAAGVSTVRVVPAFAYSAPTVSPAMSFTFGSNVAGVTPGVFDGFTVNWVTGRGFCPLSSLNTFNAVLNKDIAVTDTDGYTPTNRAHLSVTDNQFAGYEWGSGLTADGTPAAYTLNFVAGHSIYVYQPSGTPQTGDQIEMYGIVGFRCDYTGASGVNGIRTIEDAYCCVTYNGSTWSLTQGQCGA